MSMTIVIADASVRRRQAVAELLTVNARILECGDSVTLLQAMVGATPEAVVIGTIGNGPSEVVEAAHFVRKLQPAAKVIVVADVSSEAIAIGALRAGVFEYLKAPVDPFEVAEAVFRALPSHNDVNDGFEELIGVSESIREIKGFIQKIAPLNTSVLLTGESGTGKEIVARLIHQHSRRAQAPFVCVNCAALPDSLVESELFGHERGAFTGAVTRQNGQMKNADRGTLFLDEIGDMSAVAQSKMLRALEQREIQPLGSGRPIAVDVRLIAATHRDLDALVADGKFRSDLYYRLDVSRIHLPPLRERVEDIPVLAVHFVRMMNRVYGRQLLGLTPHALQTLARHDWPGNVRQLKNVIEAAAALATSDWISEGDLRALHSFSVSGPPVRTRAAAVIATKQVKPGRDELLEALEATHWNMTKTAEMLKWSRSTIYRKVARYQIQRHSGEPLREDSEEELDLSRSRCATA
jgi:two-component system response regulator HydG/two-component system response regulator AtoC